MTDGENLARACVLSMLDANSYTSWAHLPLRRMVMWAELRGYKIIVKAWCARHNTWCIPLGVSDALAEYSDCSVVLYLDADAVVANMSFEVPRPQPACASCDQ